MLSTLIWNQWYNETEGDQTQQIKIELDDFTIPCELEFSRSRSKTGFKQMVKIKAREFALNKLEKKKSTLKNE